MIFPPSSGFNPVQVVRNARGSSFGFEEEGDHLFFNSLSHVPSFPSPGSMLDSKRFLASIPTVSRLVLLCLGFGFEFEFGFGFGFGFSGSGSGQG